MREGISLPRDESKSTGRLGCCRILIYLATKIARKRDFSKTFIMD